MTTASRCGLLGKQVLTSENTSLKKLGAPSRIERVFEIVSISNEMKIALIAKCAFDGDHRTTEVTLESLLNGWCVTKMEAPINMHIHEAKANTVAIERRKRAIFSAIFDTTNSRAAANLAL